MQYASTPPSVAVNTVFCRCVPTSASSAMVSPFNASVPLTTAPDVSHTITAPSVPMRRLLAAMRTCERMSLWKRDAS